MESVPRATVSQTYAVAKPAPGSQGQQSRPGFPELVRNDWPLVKTRACRNYGAQLASPGCVQPEGTASQRPPPEQPAPYIFIYELSVCFDCIIGAHTQLFLSTAAISSFLCPLSHVSRAKLCRTSTQQSLVPGTNPVHLISNKV